MIPLQAIARSDLFYSLLATGQLFDVVWILPVARTAGRYVRPALGASWFGGVSHVRPLFAAVRTG